MNRAGGLSMTEMFQMELVIAYQCIRHPDFPEGVRALLIDKDKNPAWKYPDLGSVPSDMVKEHFKPAWQGTHPLAGLTEKGIKLAPDTSPQGIGYQGSIWGSR